MSKILVTELNEISSHISFVVREWVAFTWAMIGFGPSRFGNINKQLNFHQILSLGKQLLCLTATDCHLKCKCTLYKTTLHHMEKSISVLFCSEKVENCYTEKVTWSSSSFIFKPSSSSSLLNFKIEPSSSSLNCNVVCLKFDFLHHFPLDLKSYMVEYKSSFCKLYFMLIFCIFFFILTL
jgi:hypothetical protein